MLTQEFSLGPGEDQRLHVSRSDPEGNLTILLNHVYIGDISAQEAAQVPWTYPLSDGSLLQIQLMNQEIIVSKDGQTVAPIVMTPPAPPALSEPPSPLPVPPKRRGCLTPLLVYLFLTGILALCSEIGPAIQVGRYLNPSTEVAWPLLLIVANMNQIIGALALLYWKKKWGFYQIVAGVGMRSIVVLLFLLLGVTSALDFISILVSCGVCILLYRLLKPQEWWERSVPAPSGVATPGKKQMAWNITVVVLVVFLFISSTSYALFLSMPSPVRNVPEVATYPSYLPGSGRLALNDPLHFADNWNDDQEGHCLFTNNAYHVRTLTNNLLYDCLAQPNTVALTHATDSAFEVQMTILQGDCGGLALRISPSNFGQHREFYVAQICQNGYYDILKYNVSHQGGDEVRSSAYSAVIKQGLNQENRVDMVALGTTLSVFVNGQQLAQAHDASLTQGSFGLVAEAGTTSTDVVYRDAKIWTV